MKRRIAVVSPTRKQGETTITILLAEMLKVVAKTSVCLTHTGWGAKGMKSYLGLRDSTDVTKSIAQLARFLESGGLAQTEIGDYVTSLRSGVDVIKADDDISKDDASELMLDCIKQVAYEIILTDIETDLEDPATIEALQSADLTIIVMQQSVDTYNKFKAWQDSPYFPPEHKVLYLINEYDPKVSAVRDITKSLGIRKIRTCKVNYNPFIRILSNRGDLDRLLPMMLDNDSRVIDLQQDFRMLISMVCSQIAVVGDWPGGKE